MSREASPGTGRPYGVRRVCAAWRVPRSSFYLDQQQASISLQSRPVPHKRGPKPLISDEDLLQLIRSYLETSPFAGEGHRKVYAHLKVVQGVRTSRTRILRLMRENGLLAASSQSLESPRMSPASFTPSSPATGPRPSTPTKT